MTQFLIDCWPLLVGLGVMSVAFSWMIKLFWDWWEDKVNHEDNQNAVKAQAAQQWVEYIRQVEQQNDSMRQDLQANLARELDWMQERDRLVSRCSQMAEDLKTDWDKRRTQVMDRKLVMELAKPRCPGDPIKPNRTIEIREEELFDLTDKDLL